MSKLYNKYQHVEIQGKSGMEIRQALAEIGETDSDVIIIHAGTNNMSWISAEKLTSEAMETLHQVQQSNPHALVAYSSMFRRRGNYINEVTVLDKMLR